MGPYSVFVAVLCLFHTSEFALAAYYMRADLSLKSTLFSLPYCLAMLCASIEYWLEKLWLQRFQVQWIRTVGLALVITGEAIRKSAMVGCCTFSFCASIDNQTC
jgi:hypothetical protein